MGGGSRTKKSEFGARATRSRDGFNASVSTRANRDPRVGAAEADRRAATGRVGLAPGTSIYLGTYLVSRYFRARHGPGEGGYRVPSFVHSSHLFSWPRLSGQMPAWRRGGGTATNNL